MPRSNPTTISNKTVSLINNNQQNDDPLQKQFNNLQKEWDIIKQSISRSNRRSCSTTTTVSGDHRLFCPYDESPKELMTLLQYEYSPAKEPAINGECFDFDEDSGVSTELLFKGFENCDEKCNELGSFGGYGMGLLRSDVAVKGGRVAVKGGSGRSGGGGGCVGKWFVSVVVMLFAFVIVAFECSSEQKSILVPT